MPIFSFQQIMPFHRLQNLQKKPSIFCSRLSEKRSKWQGLLEEEEKIGRNAFRTGGKIHFKEKNILGLGAL